MSSAMAESPITSPYISDAETSPDLVKSDSTPSHYPSNNADENDHPSLYPVQSRIQHPQSLPREIAFIAIICSAQLMTQAGLGQSIAPLHIIGQSFSVSSPNLLSWIPAAYSLTVGTFILPAGRLGDLYGHKKFFIAGFFWYGLWSLIAGFSVYSKSIIFFSFCRAMQGIGPAMLLPNAIAILGRTYEPGRRQEMVFSLFGATAPSGFLVGAVFSSLFAQREWWPCAYWVAGMVCAGLGGLGWWAIPDTPIPELDEHRGESAWKRCDGLGAVVGVVALILVNFAWNQGPVVGWSVPYTYSLLIVGALFLGVFVWVEKKAMFPLIPLHVLNMDTGFVLACMAAGWASFGIWVFYTWQFLEELRGTTPLLASAYFVPVGVSGLAAAVTTGLILHRVPPSMVMLLSMSAFMTGTILIATAPVEQSYWLQTFFSIVVMPWGMDMSFPAATILLSRRLRREEQGVAASLVNTVVNYCISIGLGMAGTVEGRVDRGGEDVLRGYRGAWYLGIGLAALGVMSALGYGVANWRDSRKERRGTEKGDA